MDLGCELEITFHIERGGTLCLWNSDQQISNAPWRNADAFLQHVMGWFQNTASGWPDDNDADLERYLEYDSSQILLYDKEIMEGRSYFRASSVSKEVLQLTPAPLWIPKATKMRRKGVRRREKHLAWVTTVGEVSKPIIRWDDLVEVVGHDLSSLLDLINIGSVEYILVNYRRGNSAAGLALKVKRTVDRIPIFKAIESADNSISTRSLRSGLINDSIAQKKIAIVGCGAIGSFLADILFRSGIRNIILIDSERLKPGNLVRHWARAENVGKYKTEAVKYQLEQLGLGSSKIIAITSKVSSLADAIELTRHYDLIIDATADQRATTLMVLATTQANVGLISSCLQRNGEIIRIDRFPLQTGQSHLPSIPQSDNQNPLFEVGCGNPVTRTSPHAVIRAASLTAQIVLGELKNENVPLTLIEVLNEQDDAPYDKVGIIN